MQGELYHWVRTLSHRASCTQLNQDQGKPATQIPRLHLYKPVTLTGYFFFQFFFCYFFGFLQYIFVILLFLQSIFIAFTILIYHSQVIMCYVALSERTQHILFLYASCNNRSISYIANALTSGIENHWQAIATQMQQITLFCLHYDLPSLLDFSFQKKQQ